MAKPTKEKPRYNYSEVFRPLRGQKALLFFICSLDVVISLVIPFLLSDLINTLPSEKPAIFWQKSLVLFLLVIAGFFVNLWQNYKWHNYGWSAILLIQQNCFSHLLYQPTSYFRNTNLGDTLNKILNDSSIFAQNESISTLMLFLNLLQIVGALIFMFFLNEPLTILSATLLVLYFLFYNKLNGFVRKTSRQEREAYSSVMQNAQESLQGIETIHDYHCQSFFSGRFSNVLKNYFGRIRKLNLFNGIGLAADSTFQSFISLAAIVIGCFFIMNHQMKFGTLVAFYAYISYFAEPVKNLADFNLQRQKAVAAEERISQIFCDSDSANKLPKQDISSVQNISFDHVSFAYQGSNPIFQQLCADFKPGDRIAVVGPSGTGKSTFLKLILNHLQPSEGKITVNGVPLSSISNLNDKIAYLGQTPFLFEGTVLENISFGKEMPTKPLMEALSISSADTFCPENQASAMKVESEGCNFSGGEKQRIAFARTVVKNSDILLLDEATSALDIQTEKRVVKSLNSYLEEHPEKILIAVTHRPEIQKICNWVISLQRDGKAEVHPIAPVNI
jgi:ATP-binding cassette subfamily B protein/subfamily B ATP-binding cassette protein MsbA